jgi:hypothetical protein
LQLRPIFQPVQAEPGTSEKRRAFAASFNRSATAPQWRTSHARALLRCLFALTAILHCGAALAPEAMARRRRFTSSLYSGDIDPAAFDLRAANRALARLKV